MARVDQHRSPSDVALIGDGHLALAANSTSGTVSLVDLREGRVLSELDCGLRPVAVSASPSGRQAAVSNWLSDSVTLLEISHNSLQQLKPSGI